MKNFVTQCLAIALVAVAFPVLAQNNSGLVRHYLDASRSNFQLAPEDVQYSVTDEYFTKANGITHMYLNQEYMGIPVFQAVSALAIKDGKVVSFANRFLKKLSARVNATTPMLTPEDAVTAAAAHLNLSPTGLSRVSGLGNGEEKVVFGPAGIAQQNITVELLYQLVADEGLHLAWNVNIYVLKSDDWWNVRIDAVTGEFLEKNNWTITCNAGGVTHKHSADCINHEVLDNATPAFNNNHAGIVENGILNSQFSILHSNDSPLSTLNSPLSTLAGSYRVLPIPVESPSHGARALISNPDDPASSPFGWHDTNGAAGAEFTDTRGNNVFAQEDGDANNTGGARPNGGGGLLFDYVANFGVDAPNLYQDAAITNLFYMNNIIHDVLYHYGFDEVGGNFQENNYGNGGLGSDPVDADAQDGSGLNNANFATPADGANPRMQMFIWNAANPDRDSDMDNGVIAHEYGHGVSNRLTGGPANVNCLNNNEQMGEGWSDYMALMFSIEAGDAGTDIRGIGTYVLNQPVNGVGIRPSPYCTNFGVNNYTYADLPSMAVPHGVGFVWCTMLWDMTWDLIALHGFSADYYNGTAGNNIAMNLVMEGMRLQPCSPGFVDGRDAILAADQALYGGVHQCLIWQAFADRGLGFSAVQGSTNNASDGTAAFDLPPICLIPTVAPTANFAAAPNPSCGLPVVFTDLSTDIPQTWLWDFGDATTSNLQFPPPHTYPGPGTYTVTLTVSNGFGSDSHSSSVTVFQGATVALANGPLYCGPSVIQTTTGGAAPFTYVWSTGDVTPDITANTTGVYTLTVTDADGCTATLSATVNEGVSATVTADIPPPYCVGPSPVLTANGTGGQGFGGYGVTTIANGFVACGAGAGPTGDDVTNGPHPIGFTFNYYGQPFTTFGLSTNGNVQLGNGAYNNDFANNALPDAAFGPMIALGWDDFLSDPGDITFQTIGVSPNMIAVICFNNLNHFGGSGGNIVQGQVLLYETTDVIELHMSSTAFTSCTQGFQLDGATGTTIRNGAFTSTDARRITPLSSYQYLWSTGATTASVTANVSGTYVVTITDDLGCTATASYLVDNACCNATITEAAIPCGPSELTASHDGLAPFTYAWSTGEVASVITVTAAGIYSVTIVDANGCTATTSYNVLSAGTLPAVTISQSPAPPVCGGPVDLTAVATGGGGGGGPVNKAFLVSQVEPQGWGQPSVANALNDVYGFGGWSDFRVETVNPNTLFDINNFGVIHMEGSNTATSELVAFLSANQTLIENWVAAGGVLLLNYATNENNLDNLGFGGVQSQFDPRTNGSVVAVGHPIFNGPLTPATGNFVGNALSHNYIINGGNTLLQDDGGRPTLTELTWGSGKVLFGGLTLPFFEDGGWGPQPDVYNMYRNIYSYMADNAVGGFNYAWSTGETTGTITVASSGNYCVTATDVNGCSATACLAVTINPAATVSISQAPLSFCGQVSGTLTANGPCDAAAYYLVSNTYGEPWGMNGNLVAMDAVYGIGNWNQDFFETANVGTLFSASTGVIFLEGSDGNADELNTFFTNNQAAIEAWVAAGGQLFINAAPNEGGSQNWGFGGVVLNYAAFSGSVTTSQPGHPIFNGPYTPITNAYTGTSFGHAVLNGPFGASLLDGDAPGVVLSELNWGSGRVMFGGMTSTGWHSPFAEAQNLRQNIIDYLRVNAAVPVCCSYQWSTGDITQTITVTTSGTYTVTLTDCNGCTATADRIVGFDTPIVTIDVNPVGPACGVNPVLTAIVGGAGPPVTYTQTFVAGVDAPPSACTDWQTFRSQLTGTYTQMRIFNDLDPGITLTDPATVNALASALLTGTATSVVFGPDTYSVGGCIADFELAVNQGICSCNNQVTVRPCIGPGFAGFYASVFTDNCGFSPTQTITVEFTSGPSVTYLWSDGSTTASITATTSGTYDVTVTSPGGCTASATQTIDVFSNPVVTIVQDPIGPACGVQPTLTANVNGGGGANVFTASFTQNQDAEAFCPAWQAYLASLTGTYTQLHIFSDLNAGITLNDPTTVNNIANALLNGTNTNFTFGGNIYYVGNCGNGIELSVDQGTCSCGNGISVRPCIQPFNPNWGGVYTNTCSGPSQTMTVEFLGGGVNTYLWSDGSTTNVITATTSGTYDVTVTDQNGCTGSASQVVTLVPTPVVTITSNPAAPLCGQASAILTASSPGCVGGGTDYTVSNIGFSPIAGVGTAVFLSDDQMSGALPVGFSFIFYGNNYTDFYLSSNGFISFSPGQYNGCCSGGFVPTFGSDPSNFIAAAWDDLYPPGAGSVNYFTTGVAPNRILVVNWTNVPYCCGNTPEVTTQILLYENGNAIEIHSPSINNINPGTQGIQNLDGSLGMVVAGRNQSNWSANNDAYRFVSGSACTYLWSTGETTQDIFVNADGTYTVTLTDANGCTGTAEMIVEFSNPTVAITVDPVGPACGVQPVLTAVVNGMAGVTYSEQFLAGQGPPPANCTNWDAFRAQLTGTYSQMRMYSDLDPIGFTLNDPATVNAIASALNTGGGGTFSFGPDFFNVGSCGGMELSINQTFCSCGNAYALRPCIGADVWGGVNTPTCGGPTQTITVSFGGGGNNTFLWSDGATTAQTTATASGTYDVTITTPGGCTATSSVVVNVFTPPTVTITSNPNGPFCGLGSGELTANGPCGGNCCTYLWSTGEVTATITVTTSGAYTVTLTDCNGCTNTATQVVDFTFPTVTIDVNPVGPACGINPTLAAISPDCIGGGAAYYVVSNINGGGQPWTNENIFAMDAAFGAGNWTQEFFESLNVGTVFSPATSFVFLEGGNNTADELNTFITNNIAVIESWVNSGGRLFLNSAPNEGGMQNWGFGGVQLNYGAFSGFVTTATPGHPIFNGPSLPMSTSYTGGSFAHATIIGPSGTSLIDGDAPGTVLSELNWGSGVVMFGGMTFPSAMSPNPHAQNLFNNIVDYLGNGGTGGCTYLWSDGSTSQVITANGSGTYTVTLTSPGGCTATASTTITVFPVVTAIINGGVDLCALDPMTAVATVGTAPFTYIWNTGETTETITPGATGTYSVTITDANGCTGSAEYDETAAPVVNITADPAAGPYCGVGPELTANVIGGGAASLQDVLAAIDNNAGMFLGMVPNPSGFEMDNGVNGNQIGDGCSDMYDGGNFINTNFAGNIQYSDGVITPIGAFGPSGQYFTRYLGPFAACQSGPANMWFWAADLDGVNSVYTTGNNGADGSGNEDAFAFTVANGTTYNCFVKRVYNAGDPSINQLFIVPNGGGASQFLPGNTNDGYHEVNGLGGNNRMYYLLYASAFGGYIDNTQTQAIAQAFVNLLGAPSSYLWSDGSTTPSITPNTTGNYCVTVTDQNGCTGTACYNVVVSPAVTATINGGVDPCALDALTAIAGGGTAPFTYVWSTGETTDVITPVATGTYTVTITDASGCTASATYDEVAAPVVSISADPLGPYCGVAPVLNADVIGGVANLVYSEQFLAGQGPPPANCPNWDIFRSQLTGVYTQMRMFSDLDPIGFTLNDPATVNGIASTLLTGGFNNFFFGPDQFNVGNCGGMELSINQSFCSCGNAYAIRPCIGADVWGGVNTPTCGGPAQIITVSFASNNNTYLWSDGSTTASITPGGSGNYCVTVTDDNGCTGTACYNLVVNPAVTATINGGVDLCALDPMTAVALTGTGPYTYIWNTGETDATITPLAPGTYSVTILDAAGCTASAEYDESVAPVVDITANPAGPYCGIAPVLTANTQGGGGGGGAGGAIIPNAVADVVLNNANGGGVPMSVAYNPIFDLYYSNAGGGGFYQHYTFPGAGGVSVSNVGDPFDFRGSWWNSNTNTYESNSFAGGYRVNDLNNGNGYVLGTGTTSGASQPNGQSQGAYDAANDQVIYYDANTLYKYSRATGNFISSVGISGLPGGAINNYAVGYSGIPGAEAVIYDFANLQAHFINYTTGAYVASSQLPGGAPAQGFYGCSVANNRMFLYDGNNWQSFIITSGNNATYLWSDGSTTASITPGGSGNYCVTVTDDNGCTGTACYNLVVNPAVTATINGGVDPCALDPMTAVAGGGTAPFTYIWNTGETTDVITPVATGTYSVTITDANGCSGSAEYDETAAPVVNITADPANGPYCGVGPELTANVIGGGAASLQDVLNAINNNAGALIGMVPSPSGFDMDAFGGVNANSIGDGCQDMYDGGNFINTNFTSNIQYVDNVVTPSAAFGPGGAYFTRYLGPGGCQGGPATMWFWAADLDGVTNALTTGNNGADGQGNEDNFTFTVANGTTYNCFVKRVYNAFDPSINQLFIVPNGGAVSQLTPGFTDNNYHELVGLGGSTRMYYLLYASAFGGYIDNTQTTAIAQAFVNLLGAGVTYQWSEGSTTSSITPNTSGNYCVTVTDQNGCTGTACYNVVVNPAVTATINGGIDPCALDPMTAVAGAGTAPFSYLWNTGETDAAITPLAPGTYSVTILDAAGCTASAEYDESAAPVVSITPNPAGPYCGNIPVLTANTIGGGGGIGGAIIPNAFADVVLNNANGGGVPMSAVYNPIFDLYYTNAGGSPGLPVYTFPGVGGGALANVPGGYDYRGSWWNSNTNTFESNVFAGGYIVNDLNNGNGYALGSGTFMGATQPDFQSQGAYDAPNDQVIYYNAGTLYKYSRSTGNFISSVGISGLPGGAINQYAIGYSGIPGSEAVIYDFANQQLHFIDYTTGAYVASSQLPGGAPSQSFYGFSVTNNKAFIFDGTNWQSFMITTGNASTYLWSDGSTTASITPGGSGNYCVTVTDDNGCTGTACFNLVVNPALTATINGGVDICALDPMTAVAGGGTAPFSYLWNTGETTDVITPTASGTYSVTITDASGCTATAEYDEIAAPVVTITPDPVGPYCGNIPVLSADVAGGAAAVTYTASFLQGQTPAGTQCSDWDAFRAQLSGTYSQMRVFSDLNPGLTLNDPATVNAIANALLTGTGNSFTFGGDTYNIGIGCGPGSVVELAINQGLCTCDNSYSVRPCIGNDNWGGVNGPNCGAQSQTITVEFSGASLTYLWSDGSTTEDITPVGSGNYCVTVTDDNGCTGTACFNLEVSNISVSGVPTNTTCNVTNGSIDLTTIGAIGPVTYLWDNGATDEDLTGLLAGTYVVTATDVNGCTATTQVTVGNDPDVIPPTITCPANISVGNDPGICGAVVTFAATATDNCPGTTVAYSPISGFVFPFGTTTVTATATDAANITSTCTFTITVNDVQAPAITCPANISVGNDAGLCSATVTFAATATDNCGTATITYSPASGSTFNGGSTAVTATANDGNGNTSTCSFTVTVNDTEAPSITCPANFTETVDGNCQTILPDFSTTPLTLANSIADFSGVQGQRNWYYGQHFAFQTNNFTQLPTWTGFVWQDAQAFSTPYLDAAGGHPGVNDLKWAVRRWISNYAGLVNINLQFFDRNTACGDGAHVRVFQNGTEIWNYFNIPGALQNFNVPTTLAYGDMIDFVIDPKFDAGCDDTHLAAVITANTALTVTDNCPGAIGIAQFPAPGTTITGAGNTTVTLTATDVAGNTSTCSFLFIANDIQAPTITCPASFTVNADAGQCSANVTFLATATDNCPGTTLAYNPASGSTFALGTTVVTVTATDAVGNTSSCSFNVTVSDTEAPSVSCPADISVGNDLNACGAVVTFLATANDNCPGTTLSYNPASGSTFALGTTAVTVTATDAVGNTSSCSFNVTVSDTEAPSISCPADISVGNDLNACGAVVTYLATANDNCPGTSLTYSPASGSTFALGTTVVTVTATDAVGNTSSCSFNVTVSDTEAPSVSCPFDQTIVLDNLCQAFLGDYTGMATALDNCPGVTVTQSPAAGTLVNGVATTVVTLTATDAVGNTATCAFNVNTADNTPPSLTCPGNQSQSGASPVLLADYTGLAIASDCAGVTLTQSPIAGTSYLVNQNVTVTITATDPSGNSTTCSFNVSITVGPCGPGNRIYVDDNPNGAGNNGTSWFDAFLRLESALAIATPGTEIWVKEGTYHPTPTNTRTIFYQVPGGAQLYGGFPQAADCNSTLLDRNPDLFISNLSGDIGVSGDNADNSFCIMKALNVGGAGTIIDGFVIRDAYSDAVTNTCAMVINADGIGEQSSPEIVNCVFENNYNDVKGGAIYIRAYYGGQAAPTFTDCDFNNNSALGDGGVIFSTPKYSGSQANASFSNCNFTGNSSLSAGGVVYSWTYPLASSNFEFNNCTFNNNSADFDGGAIANVLRNDASSSFIYNNCSFTGNTGRNGSAVYNTNVTGASLNQYTQCTFSGNNASASGTVYSIVQKGGAVNTFNRVSFRDNVAINGAGSYEYNYSNGSGVTTGYTNCVFNGNDASGNGGAIYALSRLGTPYAGTVNFCTMYGNTAGGFGGAIANINQSGVNSMTVSNSIIRNNPDVLIPGKSFYTNGAGSNTVVNRCIVDNTACGSLSSGTGSFSCSALNALNPMFVDAPNGDLHILAGSSAIDLAPSGPSVDYDGGARPSGLSFDLGAYEYGAVVPRLAGSEPNIEPIVQPLVMDIFPNPTTDLFTVQFDQRVTGKLEVIDIQGRVLISENVDNVSQVGLNIGTYATGTYLVRLISENQIIVRKLVRQ